MRSGGLGLVRQHDRWDGVARLRCRFLNEAKEVPLTAPNSVHLLGEGGTQANIEILDRSQHQRVHVGGDGVAGLVDHEEQGVCCRADHLGVGLHSSNNGDGNSFFLVLSEVGHNLLRKGIHAFMQKCFFF